MSGRHFFPAIIFICLAIALYVGLGLNPRETPFALKDQPAPAFALPSIFEGEPGFSDADLRQGRVSVVNFFATWCAPCIAEHPYLIELAEKGVADIHAVNHKDSAEKAAAFLRSRGNPFDRVGADPSGRVFIDWGLSGVPETFVVDGAGKIVYRFPGGLNRAVIKNRILPLIEQLQQ